MTKIAISLLAWWKGCSQRSPTPSAMTASASFRPERPTTMSKERTIVARRLPDGTLVEVLPDGTTRAFPPDPTDWAALRAMTEDEINAAALSDPDNPPRTPKREKQLKRVPRVKV